MSHPTRTSTTAGQTSQILLRPAQLSPRALPESCSARLASEAADWIPSPLPQRVSAVMPESQEGRALPEAFATSSQAVLENVPCLRCLVCVASFARQSADANCLRYKVTRRSVNFVRFTWALSLTLLKVTSECTSPPPHLPQWDSARSPGE